MTTNIFYLTLLMTIIDLTIQAKSEVPEISHVNKRDLSQLLKLLQDQAVFDAEKQGLGSYSDHDDRDLNIQTLNLFLKKNGVEDDDIKQEISDRICKKTGICGCSRGRCGKTRTDQSVEQKDDIDELIQQLEKLLQRSEVDDLTRCGDGRCGRDRDDHDGVTSKPDTDLRQQLERFGKKYKINEDVDAIILDIDDVMRPENVLEKRLDSSIKFNLDNVIGKKKDNLKSLVLRDDLEGILGLEANKTSLLEKRLDKPSFTNNKDLLDNNRLLMYAPSKKAVSVSPEDLVEYYQVYKRDLTKQYLKYLRDPSADRQYILPLSNTQQSSLDKLKLKVIRGDKYNDKQLEKLIVQIIFEDQSKVLAHTENNDNVYVPRWLYEAVVESISEKYLRASKRLFPLTQQQKLKMLKKNQTNIGRRKLGPNVEQFGVPFNLNLHALGQAVP